MTRKLLNLFAVVVLTVAGLVALSAPAGAAVNTVDIYPARTKSYIAIDAQCQQTRNKRALHCIHLGVFVDGVGEQYIYYDLVAWSSVTCTNEHNSAYPDYCTGGPDTNWAVYGNANDNSPTYNGGQPGFRGVRSDHWHCSHGDYEECDAPPGVNPSTDVQAYTTIAFANFKRGAGPKTFVNVIARTLDGEYDGVPIKDGATRIWNVTFHAQN